MKVGVGLLTVESGTNWRKGDILKKWLPKEHENIGLIDLLKKIVGRDNANSKKKKAK